MRDIEKPKLEKELQPQMDQAIDALDCDRIIELVKQGANAQQSNSRGVTSLYAAASQGRVDALNILIEAGANVNEICHRDRKYTPLDAAASYGHTDIVKIITKAGIDKDKIQSSLYIAVLKNYTEVAEALIEAGADVNKVTENYGQTPQLPLSISVRHRDIKMIEFLIAKGADATRTNDGLSPFDIAIVKNYVDIVKIMINAGVNVKMADENGDTPLHLLSYINDQYDVIKAIAEAGAEVDAVNNRGCTPLHSAVEQRTLFGTVKALIEAGADVNKADNRGTTPLKTVLREANTDLNKIKIAALLLFHGADITKIPSDDVSLQSNLKYAQELLGLARVECAKNQRDHFALTKNPRTGSESAASMLVDDVVGIISTYTLADSRKLENTTPASIAPTIEEKIMRMPNQNIAQIISTQQLAANTQNITTGGR
jgi:ankyrin repeat protein